MTIVADAAAGAGTDVEKTAAWLAQFEQAMTDASPEALAACFTEDAHWRDLVAVTWDFSAYSDTKTIVDVLAERAPSVELHSLRLTPERTAPQRVSRGGREVTEAFIQFGTRVGWGQGVVRLLDADDTPSGLRAWILYTRLEGLTGYENFRNGPRPEGLGFDRTDTREGWSDRRRERAGFENRDPEVLVIGGGHSGLMVSAHLEGIGVDTLIIDRFARIGDNWRTRYKSLALHNPTDMNHFAYLPFPSWYPEYLPKDKLANWFEIYVEALELNYWTSTELVSGEYDESDGRWTVRVRRGDGAERVLRPLHLIMATGNTGGTPNVPEFPGQADFDGPILHTKHFTSGAEYAGKRVLVVGVGTSGHDTAYDLHINGAQVTMMQRSTVSIVNLESANLAYPPQYFDGSAMEEADLLGGVGFVLPLLKDSLRSLTKFGTERDAELLAALEARGLRLDDGEDGTGWLLKFHTKGGGYYINVGCSELIADGSIGLVQHSDIDRFQAGGLLLQDGTLREFDAVILATGYQSQSEEVRRLLGDEVADKLGPMWGFDHRGVLHNAWRRTAQPHLWFMMSGIQGARAHSNQVALQIKADIEGLVDVPNPYLEE